jgi:hypothetical protein
MKRTIQKLYLRIRSISRRAKVKGEEGSCEDHLMLGWATKISLWRFGGTATPPSISTKIWQKKTGWDLLKSVNQSTLSWRVNTCSGSDCWMSLTTTLATLVMAENRGSGNKRMKDWASMVMRIHPTNSLDGWYHLCVLALCWQSQAMSISTARTLLVVIECIYLSSTYLHFIQDIEDRCSLLMSFTSFVDLLF